MSNKLGMNKCENRVEDKRFEDQGDRHAKNTFQGRSSLEL